MSLCAISVWKWVGSRKSFNIQDGFELNNNSAIGAVMILLKTGVSVDITLNDHWGKIPPVIIKHNENN